MSTTATEPWTDRNATIAAIRAALKRRSGKAWSVTGGRGTAWGWIHVDAPPARRTAHWIGATDDDVKAQLVDTGKPGGHTPPAELAELAKLLGLEGVHHQGLSIPAGYDYRREYIDRAEGREPGVIGTPYWD